MRHLALIVLLITSTAHATPLERQELQRFIQDMHQRHGIPQQELNALFADVRLDPRVVERIKRPAEALPWHRYRKIFVTETRIRQGAEFLQHHRATLARAEREYGVSSEIITAILGVETRYGRHRGGYPVLTALTTLGLDYPRRRRFFFRELEQFLLLTREEGLDPRTVMGSYAGAMGLPQFIASSYRHYAVDFDGDGIRNLLDDPEDAIGSIANYFRRHGWKPGAPVAYPARISGPRAAHLAAKGYKPHLPAAQLAHHDVTPPSDLPPDTPVALVELEGGQAKEYWVALPNFYVITRYNHSPLYAMAVYQLAEAIASQDGVPPAVSLSANDDMASRMPFAYNPRP